MQSELSMSKSLKATRLSIIKAIAILDGRQKTKF